MPSADSVSSINAQAVRLIRDEQYEEALILLEQGLSELDSCGSLPNDQKDTCGLTLHAVPIPATTRSAKEDDTAKFAFYNKAFSVTTEASTDGADNRVNVAISDCEFGVLTCVLWYNTGLAAHMWGRDSSDSIHAHFAFERAYEYLDDFGAWDHPSAVLLDLAVMNNAGHLLYHPTQGTPGEQDDALTRLEQMDLMLKQSIRQGLAPQRQELSLFVANIRYHHSRQVPKTPPPAA